MNKISGFLTTPAVAILVFVSYYIFAGVEYFATNKIVYAPIVFYVTMIVLLLIIVLFKMFKPKNQRTMSERIRRGLLVPDRVQ